LIDIRTDSPAYNQQDIPGIAHGLRVRIERGDRSAASRFNDDTMLVEHFQTSADRLPV
jgi:hypothetical protein